MIDDKFPLLIKSFDDFKEINFLREDLNIKPKTAIINDQNYLVANHIISKFEMSQLFRDKEEVIKNKKLDHSKLKSNQTTLRRFLKKINEDPKYIEDETKNVKRRNIKLTKIFNEENNETNIASNRKSIKNGEKICIHSIKPSISTFTANQSKSHNSNKVSFEKFKMRVSSISQEFTLDSSKQVPSFSPNKKNSLNTLKQFIHETEIKKSEVPAKIKNSISFSVPPNFKGKNKSLFKTGVKLEHKTSLKKQTLTDKEKEKVLNIFRKGINQQDYLPDTNSNKVYSLINSKQPISNVLRQNNNLPSIKIIEGGFKPVTIFSQKIKSKNIESMTKEINTKFFKNFQIADTKQFSEPYQSCNDIMNIDKDEQLKNIFIKMIKKNLFFTKQINKIIENKKIEEKKEFNRILLMKWKKIIISASIHFKGINMTIEEFYLGKYSSLQPYSNEGSLNFLQAVKEGDLKRVERKINENKFVVHDFDHFKQTALHWAAKRKFPDVISLLIKNGAYVNYQDIAGRTPLQLAVEQSHEQTIKALLIELADPFIRNNENLRPIDYAKTEQIHYYLNAARILHIIHMFGSPKIFRESVQSGFEFFFDEKNKKKFHFNNNFN